MFFTPDEVDAELVRLKKEVGDVFDRMRQRKKDASIKKAALKIRMAEQKVEMLKKKALKEASKI